MGRRVASTVIVGSAIFVVLFLVWVGFRIGGQGAVDVVDFVGPAVLAAVCVPFAVARARDETGAGGRIGWWLLAACLTSECLSSAIFSYYPFVLHVEVPALSLVDLTDQLGTALTIPALLFLVGALVPVSRLRFALDGGIVLVTIFLISWVTVLREIYVQADLRTLEGMATVSHPLLDVLSMSVVVGSIGSARRVTRSFVLVGLAAVMFACTATLFNLLGALHMYDNGASPADVGYPLGFLLIAIAARLRDTGGPAGERHELSLLQVVMPYLPLAVASPIVLLRIATTHHLDAVTELLLALVVALILGRQLLASGELRVLSDSLDRTATALEEALERSRAVSAERETLIQQAPVGICQLDAELRILDANLALQRMTGRAREAMVGRPILDLVHPADRRRDRPLYRDLAEGRIDSLHTEHRLLRTDGSPLWCSQVARPLPPSRRLAGEFICILEDVTVRVEAMRRAVHVQRRLLPGSAPAIPGYELAGACLPAEDVSGDFYDWIVLPNGDVDVVVADVMGKGLGAALIMAVLRTALRSADPDLGPAQRVRIAADSIAVGVTDDGLFVTLFYARLSPASGRLRYVDAGHGYAGIRRPGGEIVRLVVRSLPIGVRQEEVFEEGGTVLEPGDALVIHSDGLVEGELRTRTLDEFEPELARSTDATEMVRLLIGTVTGRRADDVTVAVIRRRLEVRAERELVAAGAGDRA